MSDSWKQMSGTEGTNEYTVLGRTPAGDRVGIRQLSDGSVRIRVEPSVANVGHLCAGLTREEGWKQPDDNGQNRFSLVLYGESGIKAVEHVLQLLKEVGLKRHYAWSAYTWRSQFTQA
jgi:hypothetical protein